MAGAKLQQADLFRANLTGADLRGADLTGWTNLWCSGCHASGIAG